MKALIIVAALSISSFHAYAQEISVFGISLNKPLSVQECTFGVYGSKSSPLKFYNPPSQGVCYEHMGAGESKDKAGTPIADREMLKIDFGIVDRPPLAHGGYAFVNIVDGTVQKITFNTFGIRTMTIRDMPALKAKFGEPSKVINATVGNAYGATVDIQRAVWLLKDGDVTVSFDPVAHDLYGGQVAVETRRSSDLSSSEQKASSASNTQF